MRNLLIVLVLMSVLPCSLSAAEKYDHFLFGADYYPEHWPESYWEQDAQRMQECGVNVVRITEFAWYLMEPQEGTYDFALFDRAISTLARHGIQVILGTPTATPPKWLTSRYPDTLAVRPDGRSFDDQTRRHYCYNSTKYRELSRKIVDTMVSHFKDNRNVIGWQIDNEFNCHINECYSPSCRQAFREWLKKKYESLDALNERWGTRFWSQWYTAWDQVNLPFPAPAAHNPSLMLDFKRFISDSVISYQQDQIDIIRKHRPQDFITHNHFFKNINYYDFSRPLDIFAFDNYPSFQEVPQYPVGANLTLARGFMGKLMVMEQQAGPGGQTYLLRSPRPGEMSLWAFQSIAHGADGMVHFRWRTARKGAEEYWYGVLDHDNVPRARYYEFKKEGQQLGRIGKEIFGAQIISDIAVIKDFDAEWVFDHQFMTTEVNVGAEFRDLFQAAQEKKYNIDFISPQADFSRYKVIFGPHLILMDPVLAGEIKDFVEEGGTFVLSAHSAVKDRDNGMTDQTLPILVKDLFGVEVNEFQCYPAPSKDKNDVCFTEGIKIPVHVFADGLKLTGASAIASWDRDFLKGIPAVTENKAGKGKAVYYGSFFNLEAARYLIQRYATEHQLQPLMAGLPKEVEVTRRSKGGHQYFFVLNHADQEVTAKPGAGYLDMLEGRELPASLVLKPYEYKVLRK